MQKLLDHKIGPLAALLAEDPSPSPPFAHTFLKIGRPPDLETRL
jgi:hypothetical protein